MKSRLAGNPDALKFREPTAAAVMKFRQRLISDREKLIGELEDGRREHFDAEALGLLQWKLTFNTYEVSEASKMSGFGFHLDLPSNGEVTAIFSLGRDSLFEIEPLKLKVENSNTQELAKVLRSLQVDPRAFRAYRDQLQGDESKRVSLPLKQGELVALTGASRWLWQHRVRPVDVENNNERPLFTSNSGKDIHRASLVLGCQ